MPVKSRSYLAPCARRLSIHTVLWKGTISLLSTYAENIRRHCTKFIRRGDQMLGICGPLCYNVWTGQTVSANVFVDTNNWMSESSKANIKRCRNLFPEKSLSYSYNESQRDALFL